MIELPVQLRSKFYRLGILVAIILLGTALRLVQLDRVPPGMFYDESFNAIQARNVERGIERPVFFVGNGGEEPLQMYVAAGVFALAGESGWSLRLSVALLDLLIIPGLYICGRALFPRRPLVALVAAFIGATLYWIVNMSRIGYPTQSLAVGVTLSAAALALAYRTRKLQWGILGGLLLGLTLYTYPGARAWPIALAAGILYLIVFYPSEIRARITIGAIAVGVAILVVAPLALFFVMNPVAFATKVEQVAEPNSLLPNLARIAGMFSIAGDTDPRDNLPGRPALDLFLSLLFIVGLLVSLRRWRRPAFGFLLIWFLVMTLPSAVTIYAPNFRRTVGAMPAVALFCGLGADWLGRASRGAVGWGRGRLDLRRWSPAFVPLLALGLAFGAWSGANAYWNVWAHDSQLYYSFDEGLNNLTRTLASRPAADQLYLTPDYHDHPTVQWTMGERALSSFDGRRVLVLPDPAQPATFGIITRDDKQTMRQLNSLYPQLQPVATLVDRDGQVYARVIEIPADQTPRLAPRNPLDAQIGSARVLGYDLSRDSTGLELKVYWRASNPMSQDYTVFVHEIGPENPANDSTVWATADSQPGGGTYPTSRWRTGETIIDNYTLGLPSNEPAGSYQIELGMYLLSTGARLPVTVNGIRDANERLLLNVRV